MSFTASKRVAPTRKQHDNRARYKPESDAHVIIAVRLLLLNPVTLAVG